MKYIIMMSCILALPTLVLAQGPPPATPIDGGLGLLLLAGSVYGIKKTMTIDDDLLKG